MKLPSFQFYPADWRKDPGVQSLSFHDRGVWFEILCLMHESEQRGKLLLNGKAMPEEALARLLGLDKQSLTTTITTLLEFGVASRCEQTGALTNRRMVKDEEIRKIRQNAGKLGGNPSLLKQKSNQTGTTQLNLNPTPSSSSSSSSSEVQTPLPPSGEGGEKKTVKGPLQLRAEKLKGRKPETPLTEGESRAFKKNRHAIEATSEEDWKALEQFYAAPQTETLSRKDLATLLNNWNGEIDRAKAWLADPNRGRRPSVEQKQALEELIKSHPCNNQSQKHTGQETKEQWEDYRKLKTDLQNVIRAIAAGGAK